MWQKCFFKKDPIEIEWEKDRTPLNEKLFLATEADISFCATLEKFDQNEICYPCAKEPQVDDEIYLIGFPANYSDMEIKQWLEENYVKKRNPELATFDERDALDITRRSKATTC